MSAKILLVEDEMFVRELYERVLAQAGFTIITAADGLSGLEKAEEKPNLILLDIMLPGLDGIQVLQRLKHNGSTRDIPVVLLTNLGQESIIKQALALGAAGYLMKVRISPYQLLSYVKEFIQNPSLKIEPKPTDFD